MIEAPKTSPYPGDGPTQPFSRTEIERMQRTVEANAPTVTLVEPAPVELPPLVVVPDVDDEDQDWFEIDGRRIRVSLEAFADICLGQTPANMIGSSTSSFVCGELGAAPDVPRTKAVRAAGVHEIAVPEPLVDEPTQEIVEEAREELEEAGVGARGGLRKIAVVVGLMLMLAGVGVSWQLTRASDPSIAEAEPVAELAERPSEVAPNEPPAAELLSSPPDVVMLDEVEELEPDSPADVEEDPKKGRRKTKSRTRSKPGHQSSECADHRDQATNALRRGQWSKLEQLARSKNCWANNAEPNRLRLRALFELERHEDCIKVGSRLRSRDANKWVNNCKRALQQ